MKNGLFVDSDGSQYWYLNGKRHREGGPAVIYADGTQEWWLNGKNYLFEYYLDKLFPNDSPERTLFLLNWSR